MAFKERLALEQNKIYPLFRELNDYGQDNLPDQLLYYLHDLMLEWMRLFNAQTENE